MIFTKIDIPTKAKMCIKTRKTKLQKFDKTLAMTKEILNKQSWG